MPHAAAHVATNPHFEEFQARVNGKPKNIQQALDSLQSGRPLVQLAQGRVTDDMTQHFDNHWLSAGWPSEQSVEQSLRDGLINALETTQRTGLPLQTIIVGGASAFAVSVVPSDHQVTMVITVPAPPGPAAT
jgi:hypothetical protein